MSEQEAMNGAPPIGNVRSGGPPNRNGQSGQQVMVGLQNEDALGSLEFIFAGKEPKVRVSANATRLAGDGNGGIFLSQALYWLANPDGSIGDDGHGQPRAFAWGIHRDRFVTTRSNLSIQTGLSVDQIKRGLVKLRGRRLIQTSRDQRHGLPALVIRLGDQLLPQLGASSQQTVTAEGGNVDNAKRRVLVPAGMTRMAGCGTRSLVLGQIVFWHRPDKKGRSRLQFYRDGHYWIAKRYQEHADDTGLSKSQVESAVRWLEHKGWIETTVHKLRGQPTLWVRLVYPEFLAAWREQDDEFQRQREAAELE